MARPVVVMSSTTCLLASTDWCSRVGGALYEFCQSGALCDTIIHTKDDQRLSAHANVLAAASPVLKVHIAGSATRPYNLRLGDVSSDVALKLLQFIYCGTLQVREDGLCPADEAACIIIIKLYCHIQVNVQKLLDKLECSLALTCIVPKYTIK